MHARKASLRALSPAVASRRRSLAPLGLAGAIALHAAGAAAQEADYQGSIPLDPLEVFGSSAVARGWQGASGAIYDTPGAVSEIGRQAIDERGGARNAADIFRGVSGVNAIIDRQNPGLNVNIRGLQDQGRVNMSIDGARQNFQQSGHGASAFALVDPELIGGADIDKGPSSTAGGAGVIGGVVNFRTLDFDDIALPGNDYGVRLNATGGTNQFDFNGSLAAAARVSDAFELVAAVGRKKLGEYEIGKRGEVEFVGGGEPAEFTTQDQWSWLLKATAEPADGHKLTLGYTGLSADFGSGSGTFVDTNAIKNHTVVADYRWTPGEWWADLAAKLYYTRTANDQFRPARTNYDAFRVDYAIDTVGGSLANTTRFAVPLFDVALTYGAEYFFDKTDTASVAANPDDDPNGIWFGADPIGERGVGGAFARAELRHGDWLQILGGLRYDRFDLKGSGSVYDLQTRTCCLTPFDVDRSGGGVSPTATMAVTPIKGVQLYGSYEQGWRPPTIMESILGGTHIGGASTGIYFAPNPDLEPEVARTFEAGLNLKFDELLTEGDALRGKISIYSTEVENYITQGAYYSDYPDVGIPYLKYVNLRTPAKLKGIDVEVNYDAGFAYIGGSASVIDAKYNLDYDAGPNAPYPSISSIYLAPKTKYVLDGGLRLLDRKVTLGGRLTHVTPDDFAATQPGFFKYNKYTLLDIYGSLEVNDNVNFRASVDNLRDVAYVEAMGSSLSPSPGRTFTLGATVRF